MCILSDTYVSGDDVCLFTDSCRVRCVNGLKVTWAFIGSVLDSVISVLFKISNEYRSVSLILDQEREEEKRRRRMVSVWIYICVNLSLCVCVCVCVCVYVGG